MIANHSGRCRLSRVKPCHSVRYVIGACAAHRAVTLAVTVRAANLGPGRRYCQALARASASLGRGPWRRARGSSVGGEGWGLVANSIKRRPVLGARRQHGVLPVPGVGTRYSRLYAVSGRYRCRRVRPTGIVDLELRTEEAGAMVNRRERINYQSLIDRLNEDLEDQLGRAPLDIQAELHGCRFDSVVRNAPDNEGCN